MTGLLQLQAEIQHRVDHTASTHGNWPCRKGCDDCCRSLASVPRITADEWLAMSAAIGALPPHTAERVRERIRASAHLSRPVLCPLLDTDCGACLIYEARPLACRAYGFYADRDAVLGCARIAAISRQSPGIIWGNHTALEEQTARLGPSRELAAWLNSTT